MKPLSIELLMILWSYGSTDRKGYWANYNECGIHYWDDYVYIIIDQLPKARS